MIEKIRDMADELDAGNKAWFHRPTQTFLSHPDPAHHSYDNELDYLVEETMDEVMLDFDNYVEIPAPDSTESYRIMEGFADMQVSERIRHRLFDALGGKKPFKFFRNAVEEADLIDDWYEYRDARMQDYVMGKLEEAV
jgi:hypothetical protein